MNQLETLKNLLSDSGHSITNTRILTFGQLLKLSPISAAELAANCPSVDRATTYRTLELFEKLAIVKRIWLGFKSKYELADRFDPHHHHLACLNCHQVTTVHDAALEQRLSQVAKANGMKAVDHQVEITGYCRHCQRLLS